MTERCKRCPYPEIAARGDAACDQECSWDGTSGTEIARLKAREAALEDILRRIQEHYTGRALEYMDATPAEAARGYLGRTMVSVIDEALKEHGASPGGATRTPQGENAAIG